MEYIKEITANLSGEDLFEYITAVQGDTARGVRVRMIANNMPYTSEAGARAVLRAIKPDGTSVMNDGTIENGTVKAMFTEQITAAVGNVRCEISIYGADGGVITTVKFILKVTPASVAPDIQSTNEFTALENALIKVNQSAGVAQAALETADNALNKMAEVEATIGGYAQDAAAAAEAEEQRASAEEERNSAELLRSSAEEARNNAEEQRIENEQQRQADFKIPFIAYSDSPDGTEYTFDWTEGQNYIGIATGKEPPATKSCYTWTRIADLVNVVQSEGSSTTDAMSQKAVTELLKKVKDDLSRTTKELANLKAGISPDFITDDGTAYVKDVPGDVCPYAMINRIGGMTYKCSNLFDVGKTEDYFSKAEAEVSISDNVIHAIIVKDNSGRCINLKNKYKPGVYTVDAEFSNGVKRFLIRLFDQNGNVLTNEQISLPELSYNVAYGGWNNSNGILTITIPDEVAYWSLGFVFSGSGSHPVGGSMTISNIMLVKGNTALPYEPYFSGLRDAKVTEIESVGSNLIPFPYYAESKTQNGITFTVNNDGSITVDGTSTAVAFFVLKYDLLVDENKSYTFSGCPLNGSVPTYSMYIAQIKGDTSTFIRCTGTPVSFTPVTSNLYEFVIRIGENVTVENLTFYPMLNEGSTALPYTPYTKRALPIPSTVQALEGYGQGVDNTHYNKIVWNSETGKVEYHKECIQIIPTPEMILLDSIESHKEEGYSIFGFSLDVRCANNILICNRFNKVSHVYATKGKEGIGTNSEGTHCYIKIAGTYTLEQFRALMTEWSNASDPLTIVFGVAEPEITDITDLISTDNLIPVEPHGPITAVNEYQYPVPTSITYQLKQTTATEEESA